MLRSYKVWLELKSRALHFNIKKIRSKIAPTTKIWAVVKSNAYGHGLVIFSKLANGLGIDGFCVDSVVEGVKLRQNGITKPILVLGATIPDFFSIAENHNLTLTISSQFFLYLSKNYPHLPFHLKIDTGMHRQGFYPEDIPRVIAFIRDNQINLQGVYSHLAMPVNKKFSQKQCSAFEQAIQNIEQAWSGKILVKHLTNTRGLSLGKLYHYDAVRIGMGLYGCLPGFQPVLSWYSVISEIKKLQPGDYVGYDLTKKINRSTTMAIVPIGYWHGFERSLSNKGEVFLKNKKAPVLGRVSMDMIAVDITKIPCRVGDTVTVLGSAAAMAKKLDTTPYEILTRINPLIKKFVI